MSTKRLSKERIKELWAAFDVDAWGWSGWRERLVADLRWARETDADTLHSAEGQRKLWSLTGMGTVGAAEHLSVEAVLTDPAFADALCALRERGLDAAPSRRAAELHAAYNALVTRYRELSAGNLPRSRLVRAIHALRPQDLLCTYNDVSTFAVRDLLIGGRGQGFVEMHVLCRARLDDVLGPAHPPEEHAKRAMFGWWLYENAELIASGGVPAAETATGPTVEPPADDVQAAPRLQLMPYQRQHRWLDLYRGGLDTLRLVLRECIEPQSVPILRAALDAESDGRDVNERYTGQLLNDLRRLGFVHRAGADYETTPDGEAVLGDAGEEVIATALAARFKAFAFVLRELDQRGPLRAAEVAEVLKDHASAGSLAALAARHLWWGALCGLLTRTAEHAWTLTAAGEALAARLPDALEGPSDAPDVFDVAPEERELDRLALPDFAALAQRFDTRCAARGLVFSKVQLLSLHSAWQFAEDHAVAGQPTKRFAILSGLSGTGKTQLLQQYAHTLCELMELDPERHIAAVAVRPDWRDPTGLLGYLNALHAEPSFHAEPALRLVLAAVKSPHLPYFLLLDEMNLARVERYFAPFLSSMENGAPLQLHAQDDVVDGVPGAVRWPDNLRIGGSVNMDETTHPFSDKVLDRAFTLEFWDVDLPSYFARRPNRTQDDAVVEALLLKVQRELTPIRRHFGYRTAGEVLAWVAHARATPSSGVTLNELLDQALFSKVLPRLRGADAPAFTAALANLRALCKQEGLAACEAKLKSMAERLDETGVTGFWA